MSFVRHFMPRNPGLRRILPVAACLAAIGLCPAIGAETAADRSADAARMPVNRLETMGPFPEEAEGLETSRVRVTVDPSERLGPFPPIQGDLSQGAETGDPDYFEEMEDRVAELRPGIVRVSPFAQIESAVSTNETGELIIDFSLADRIIASLRRAGAEICWNCASWPRDWRDRYPKDLGLFEEFVRRVVERYNGNGERNIGYIEFWNEPPSFDPAAYDAMVRGARAADPGVKVGAPAVMDLNRRAIEQALRHAAGDGAPLDFISFHLYGKAPWDWPGIIEDARGLLAKYPGMENLEILITEWGLDAGESGVCDTLYNAAYYCSVLERMLPLYPQVRPCYFELRDGWDWKGPSRDLFGRWGMLTYSNLLPKPVFQAARMWNRMQGGRIRAESSDPRIRVEAAAAADQVAVLIWSFPPDLWPVAPTSPLLYGPSPLDIPVEITIRDVPFASTGLAYERYQLDALRSNVNASPRRTNLEKVHDVVLTRRDRTGESFQVPVVLPLHGVTLLVLRPAERAPADVVGEADRFQIWAGEAANVSVRPRADETFPVEWMPDPIPDPDWEIRRAGRDPLRLVLRPRNPALRANRFFTAWIRRPDWGAWGRVVLEFRTDNPLECTRKSRRIDLDAVDRTGTLRIPFRNRTADRLEARLRWSPEDPLRVTEGAEGLRIPPKSEATAIARMLVPDPAPPGRYLLETLPNTGVDLEPVETEVFLPLPSVRFVEPPAVDGNIDEWSDVPSVAISGTNRWDGHHLSRYTGPDDLSGVLRSAWDDRYLYFAVEVVDDHHYAPVANGAMHEYDCLHMGFDLRRDMLDRREFFVEDDCDYLFTFTDRGRAYRHWGAKRPEEVPRKVLVGAVRSGTRIRYEIAFPWEEEFAPYAGPDPERVIGFSLYLRDIDPGEEQGFLWWGRGLDWHTKRPALFWSLQLVDTE